MATPRFGQVGRASRPSRLPIEREPLHASLKPTETGDPDREANDSSEVFGRGSVFSGRVVLMDGDRTPQLAHRRSGCARTPHTSQGPEGRRSGHPGAKKFAQDGADGGLAGRMADPTRPAPSLLAAQPDDGRVAESQLRASDPADPRRQVVIGVGARFSVPRGSEPGRRGASRAGVRPVCRRAGGLR